MANDVVIGLLHPGKMGASIGGALVEAGRPVLWASEGRAAATARRAEQAGLADAGTISAVASASDVIVSVCPPHAARDVAAAVAGARFSGVYVDANAVSPATACEVGEV